MGGCQAPEPAVRKRAVGWVILISVSTLLLCCGGPFYLFFFHCPGSDELVAVRRQIRVGMSVGEAKKVMSPEAKDVPDRAVPGRGELWEIAYTSVQCECRLRVKYDAGKVTEIEFYKYDDLSHNTWDFD